MIGRIVTFNLLWAFFADRPQIRLAECRAATDIWLGSFIESIAGANEEIQSRGRQMLQIFGASKNKSNGPGAINGARDDDVRSFVERLAREYFFDGPDRREEPRLRITMPLILKPLDDRMRPLNYQVRAVTRDLSPNGIGLICQDPVNGKFLSFNLVSPCGAELNVIAEVLRCEAYGYYYDVGCTFVVRQDVLT